MAPRGAAPLLLCSASLSWVRWAESASGIGGEGRCCVDEVLLQSCWHPAGRASPLLVLPFLFCVPVGSSVCWLWTSVFSCLLSPVLL